MMPSRLNKDKASPEAQVVSIEAPKQLPVDVKVANSPHDLPFAEKILSGMDPKFPIQLSREEVKNIVALQTSSKTALMVGNAAIYGTDLSREMFRKVRGGLTTLGYDITTHWATAEVVEQYGDLRSESAAGGAGARADDIQTESGEQSWARMQEWVRYGVREGASDIHIEIRPEKAIVRYRILGELETMRDGGTNGTYLRQLAMLTVSYMYNKRTDTGTASSTMWTPGKQMWGIVTMVLDGTSYKLRCNYNPGDDGDLDVIIRITPKSKKNTYEALGFLPSQIRDITIAARKKRGWIVVTGETNSGKSTLLRTVTDHLPNRERRKLVEIGDPIEVSDPTISQKSLSRDLTNQEESLRKVGEVVSSWLRGDTDVFTFAEIRDYATGVGALTFTQTGHLSLSTSHVRSAFAIPERFSSPAIGLDLISLTAPDTLTCLIGMQLVPVLCDACKIPLAKMPQEIRDRMESVGRRFNVDMAHVAYRKHDGCPACRGRGATRLTAIAEVVRPDEQLLKLLRNRDEFGAIKYWRTKGDGSFDSEDMTGKTIFEHAFYLMLKGMLDPDEVEAQTVFEEYPTVHPVDTQNSKVA